MAEFNRISHFRSFNRGQTIVGQNDHSTIVGNVVSGTVKLCKLSLDGEQRILGLLFPTDFFGRVHRDDSRFSYEAASDVILCCIDRREFEQLMARFPEVQTALLQFTLDELDAQREWTNIISRHSTMERIAFFLYVLSRRFENQTCRGSDGQINRILRLPISRQDIADFLGTTPETLSRNFHELDRKKVIRIIDPSNFELLNEAGLIEHSGETRQELADNAILPMPHG